MLRFEAYASGYHWIGPHLDTCCDKYILLSYQMKNVDKCTKFPPHPKCGGIHSCLSPCSMYPKTTSFSYSDLHDSGLLFDHFHSQTLDLSQQAGNTPSYGSSQVNLARHE